MNWLASGISEAFIWAFLDDLRYPNLQKKKGNCNYKDKIMREKKTEEFSLSLLCKKMWFPILQNNGTWGV